MSNITQTTTPTKRPEHDLPRSAPKAISARQLAAALPGAFVKLDPRQMWRNPVMFIVEIGAVLTTALAIAEPFLGGPSPSGGTAVPVTFTAGIAFWLWLTVVFANLAESVAEGRGKAQADSLRQTRTSTTANRVIAYDPERDSGADRSTVETLSSAELGLGDTVIVLAGELVPGDGDIVWGIASIDESAITGESAPVIRESGGDRSAVT